jgi:Holliday junction resolvase RusA-like endonuclease
MEEIAKQVAALPLGEPLAGPVAVWMRFAVPKPKTTKLSHPSPDIDNYEKALFDALTKAGNVWNDDKQIVKVLESAKVWTDVPTGGIVVQVIPLDPESS